MQQWNTPRIRQEGTQGMMYCLRPLESNQLHENYNLTWNPFKSSYFVIFDEHRVGGARKLEDNRHNLKINS